MTLKIRATGLSSPVDEHLTDFTVLTGEWVIGRIYEVPIFAGSGQLNGPMKRSDRVASLDEAKDQFKTSWKHGRFGQTWRSGIRRTLMSYTELCERVVAHGNHPRLGTRARWTG